MATATNFAERMKSDEAMEGIGAFLSKQTPGLMVADR